MDLWQVSDEVQEENLQLLIINISIRVGFSSVVNNNGIDINIYIYYLELLVQFLLMTGRFVTCPRDTL